MTLADFLTFCTIAFAGFSLGYALGYSSHT